MLVGKHQKSAGWFSWPIIVNFVCRNCMIGLEFITPTGGLPPFRPAIEGLGALRLGASRGLDVSCNGILSGSDFIDRAEA